MTGRRSYEFHDIISEVMREIKRRDDEEKPEALRFDIKHSPEKQLNNECAAGGVENKKRRKYKRSSFDDD